MAYAILFFMVVCISARLAATQSFFTAQTGAVVGATNFRTIQNSALPGFSGYHDVWTNGKTFTTDMKVDVAGQQAWPQIQEGVTGGIKSHFAPGYPLTVQDYLDLPGNRYISYNGRWTSRTNGPDPKGAPTGNRYNGGYIWLNDPGNYDGDFPIFPFAVEINIWNKHDLGIPPDTESFGTYYDSNGAYSVQGRDVEVAGDKFYAYYVLLEGAETSSMVINIKALLRYLIDNGRLNAGLEVVGIYVAAEGHGPANGNPGADGKFMADINTMGRP